MTTNHTPSTYPSVEALLTALGWPTTALDQKGSMNWSKTVGDPPDRVVSAVLLCTRSDVRCRLLSADVGGTVNPPHLETTWSFDASGVSYRGAWEAGKPADLSEKEAMGRFQDRVNLMAVRPSFQAMGTRQRPAVEADSPSEAGRPVRMQA